jgi:hypothetical protein
MTVHRAKPVLLLPSFIGVLLLWCLLSGSVLAVTGQEKEEEEENEGQSSVIDPTKAAPTILSSLVKAEMSRQVQAVLGNITRVHNVGRGDRWTRLLQNGHSKPIFFICWACANLPSWRHYPQTNGRRRPSTATLECAGWSDHS